MYISGGSRAYLYGSMAYQDRNHLRNKDNASKAFPLPAKESGAAGKRTPDGMPAQEIPFHPADRRANDQTNDRETGTKSDIIVKPDGSRVLVVTMNVGGMQTTMSIEIAKPTDMPNGNSKQEKEEDAMQDPKEDMASAEVSDGAGEA